MGSIGVRPSRDNKTQLNLFLCEDGSALAKVPHGSKIKKRCIIAIDTLVLDLDQRTTKVRGIEKGIRCIFVSNEQRNQQNATG